MFISKGTRASPLLIHVLFILSLTIHCFYVARGKFDHPDRLFQSVEGSWVSASGGLRPLDITASVTDQRQQRSRDTQHTNMQDVKELIPEFYCLPEFLDNINKFDLGQSANSGIR
jgi:hypothetical protein